MQESSLQTLTTTGVEISYYFICRRKLWYFSHHISMEHTSESVALGQALHEHAYTRNRKEIQIGPIKIDFFEKNKALIHEVKKSKAIEEAHIWQVKYYLYVLQQLGVDCKASIDYPLLKRRQQVALTTEDIAAITELLGEINAVKHQDKPAEVINSRICKKCSYYELCYIGE